MYLTFLNNPWKPPNLLNNLLEQYKFGPPSLKEDES